MNAQPSIINEAKFGLNIKKGNLINIRGTTDSTIHDSNYRYKMEEVTLNHQKTKIVFENINTICEQLNRDPNILLKFLKKQFGTSFEYKNNQASATKLIMKDEMQNKIFKFIDEYVLCKGCHNPETIYEETKGKKYFICKACGYTNFVR